MNDAIGIFSTWPGTLGLAAAAKGDIKNGGDAALISKFAGIARKEWDATGIRKGYMYMADVVTDPRWQQDQDIPFEEVGFAFNHYFLNRILREELGFKGYVNSDSGIINNMSWGMESHSEAKRFAKAINAGTDIIADTNDIENLKLAISKGWISENRINEANIRLLTEMFALGLFDDRTYNQPEYATEVISTKEHWEAAYEAHKKSTTILKNSNLTLPLTKDKLAGQKVYVEVFHKESEQAAHYTEKARKEAEELGLFVLTDQYEEAGVAILFLHPKSGSYFNATLGLLELEICENKVVSGLDGTLYQETTLSGIDRLNEIAANVHSRGGKVVMSVNIILPWIVGKVEPLADALVAGYDTFFNAQLEVIAGNDKPTGVLPITLPANNEVIAVYQNGECVSRNDVPGYDKDKYMPNGLRYAYTDGDGNEYKLGHGLTY